MKEREWEKERARASERISIYFCRIPVNQPVFLLVEI